MKRRYTHWFKIDGTVSDRDEYRQYKTIADYLQEYPDAVALMFVYECHLFHRVVKLECGQNWDELDLSANTLSHSLRRLTRKPKNIKPFKSGKFVVPDRVRNYTKP